jgi:DNA repair photolyase
VIPGLTDEEIPAILGAAASAGAQFAGYAVLRLPYSVKDLFVSWLEANAPEKKNKVLSRIRALRGGRLNDSRWHLRLSGEGPYSEAIEKLFRWARESAGLPENGTPLSVTAFRRPSVRAPLFRDDL